MDKLIVEKISNNLKWYEKGLIKIIPKTFIKVYKIGMVECFNFYNK